MFPQWISHLKQTTNKSRREIKTENKWHKKSLRQQGMPSIFTATYLERSTQLMQRLLNHDHKSLVTPCAITLHLHELCHYHIMLNNWQCKLYINLRIFIHKWHSKRFIKIHLNKTLKWSNWIKEKKNPTKIKSVLLFFHENHSSQSTWFSWVSHKGTGFPSLVDG